MKPGRIFLFLFLCLFLLGLTAFLFPKNGITILGKNYRFVSLSSIFSIDTTRSIDVEKLLKQREDSLKASLKKVEKDTAQQAVNNPLLLQYNDSLPHSLDAFFESLYALSKGGPQVRILHYGDSQIEEDRISSYVRAQLQAKFGGGGLGLLSIKNITNSLSVSQNNSANWERYTAFGNPDSTINGRYGAMAIVCKMSGEAKDSTDTLAKKNRHFFGSASYTMHAGISGRYSHVKIYLGNRIDSVLISVNYNGLTEQKKIAPENGLQVVDFALLASPKTLTINFAGKSSPEVYGVSLQQENGVLLDNIPMRGCSGTMFGKLNYALTNDMYASLKADLFILQYGGNTIPYIQSQKEAAQYANYFKANMQRIKSMNPNASFIVIGPSDMSTKIDGIMQTYPILPTVRDEMKKVSQEMGAAYFDLYEVMGGKNAMPSWVNAQPALAAKDYIHFSPMGATRIAKLFYDALLIDYEAFLIRTGKKQMKK
jgi:hypothetical protein